MAAKRFLIDHQDSESVQEKKRIRKLPSFSTVIREAVMVKNVQTFGRFLEPMIRKVVKEEVEQAIIGATRLLQRSSQMQLEAGEPSSGMKLIFRRPLSLPIFTGSKIEDAENNLLEIILVDPRIDGQNPVASASPIKVEIVAINGDFPKDEHESWTSAKFNKHIVKERTGRRPLITGDVQITLREGTATIGELTFTDNSSWIRSRHFRIGARVVPGSDEGPRIQEALTERFMVRDHRGELYRKHYPPSLLDEVWRLDRIAKDGAFHKKLSMENINTVQDFLSLWSVDPDQLRRILGLGMSDRMWEGTINHARTCPVGEKMYIYHGESSTLLLNPICQILEVAMDGMTYNLNELNTYKRAYVEQLAREAYNRRDTLEDANGLLGQNTIRQSDELILQGGNGSSSLWCPAYQQGITTTSQFHILDFEEDAIHPNNLQIGHSDF